MTSPQKHFLFIVFTLLSYGFSYAQITKTVGQTGGDYPTLKAAFDAINNAALTGDVSLEIIDNTTETASPVLFGNDKVFAVNITNGGSGYAINKTTVTFSAPPAGGVTAVGSVVLSGNVITSITLTNSGYGYTSPPTITIGNSNGGVGVNATATVVMPNYSSVKIYPTVAGKTIFGSEIVFDGADNVTIDGRLNQTGSSVNLTINNNQTATTSTAATINFKNEATHNVIKYTKLMSGANAFAGTTIDYMSDIGSVVKFWSSKAGTIGNSDNTIEYCELTGIDSYRPRSVISSIGLSTGSSTTAVNQQNIIRNNNIYDHWATDNQALGIIISSNSDGFVIENNSFYATTLVPMITPRSSPSRIISLNSGAHTIRNNYIGGSAPQCGGSPFSCATDGGTIRLISIGGTATTRPSSIQGNVISNLEFNGSSTLGGDLTFIYIDDPGSSGNKILNVDIGTEIGNRIGSTSQVNNIVCTNFDSINGISSGGFDNQNSTNGSIWNIKNNTIGGISVGLINIANYADFYGINLNARTVHNIENNIIGSDTIPFSINATNSALTFSQNMVGIYSNSAFIGPKTIKNNLIANLVNGSNHQGPAGPNGYLHGIDIGSTRADYELVNNRIHDLSIGNANNVSATNSSLVGIFAYSVGLVKGNVIYNLSNSNASFAGGLYGLYYTGSGVVSQNYIYAISANTNASNAKIRGIYCSSGTPTLFNNVINLGGNHSYSLYGIEYGFKPNIYHNTIYISGNATGGTASSYALYSSNTPTDFRNNLLVNARSNTGGSGKNYGSYFTNNNTISSATIMDNNNYWVTGTGGMLGYYGSINGNIATMALWRTATGREGNGIALDPQLDSPGGTVAINYKPNATSLVGVNGTGVTTDYLGVTRASIPTIGAFEYCLNTISSISPTTGVVGSSVQIIGTDFSTATAVTFNGQSAIYTINSPALITVTVPAGATTGKITVSKSCGDALSPVDFTVIQPAPLTATSSQTNNTVYGGTTGTATVVASGGAIPYTYLWSPSGGTAASATGLAAGNYSCTITDNNGATLVKTFIITQATQAPVLLSPSSNSNVGTTIPISYSLPEAPLSGSVRLTFTPLTGGNPIVWTMNDATSATFAYPVGSNPTLLSPVVSGSSLDFTTYNITLSYQDVYGNPAALVTNTSIQFLAPPVNLSYSLPSTFTKDNVVTNIVPSITGTATSFSVSPALPSGLTLNTTTGVISGTPTVAATLSSYVVTATNSSGSTSYTLSFAVDKATPAITSMAAITKTFGDAAFTLTAPTSNGTGAFTFTSTDTAVATISGNIVTIVGVGTATITATQATDANYLAGLTSTTLTVGKATPVLSNFNVITTTIDSPSFTLTAPTSSGGTGAISYTSNNTAVATISGATVTIVGVGTAIITATQASDANYNSQSITALLTVGIGTTQSPILTSPATGTSGVSTLNIIYTLPETPLAGSVRLTFTPTAGGIPIVWTMTNATAATFAYPVGTNPTLLGPIATGSPLDFTTYDLTLSYQDVYGSPATSVTNTSIQILAPPSITLANTSYSGLVNTAFTTITVTNTGGVVSSFAISPNLPTGLTLNTTTGAISGTPTTALVNTTYTITATNPAGTATRTFSLFIDADTDGDGVPDAVEIQQGTDPNVAGDALDTDGDGVPDYVEQQQGTNPNSNSSYLDTDGDGLSDYYEANNSTPTDISLTANTINENNAINAFIGNLATTDVGDVFDHTYTLVSGVGSIDNASFSIVGKEIKAGIAFDFETKSNYSIRVKTTDAGGLSYEKVFAITVVDVVENVAPTNIALSTTSIAENNAADAVVGTLSSTDADSGDTHTYTLVSGTGATDNASFSIVGNQIKAGIAFDFETKSSYSVRVKTTDAGGLSFEKVFTVTVTNVNETPILSVSQTTNLGVVGIPLTTITVTNSSGPVSSFAIAPALSAGLTFNTTTGAISGTPTLTMASRTYTISGTNSDGTGTVSFSLVIDQDTDKDGLLDSIDTDDDGDGIVDINDAFPTNPREWKDTDRDGTGDNTDSDDDNDGILDTCDVDVNGDGIPDNGTDMDGDGINDDCDTDKDGDGVNNTSDTCPNIANRDQADRDHDGLGDVCDTVELNVSEAITPNGDGINDTWMIYNIENHPNTTVRVFNRWGSEVFLSRDYKNDWDGHYNGSSTSLPKSASYLYQVDLNSDGTIEYSGWLYITK